MPAPKRLDVDDFFAKLNAKQRPYLNDLRQLSLTFAPAVVEQLKWNQPAYTHDGELMWMLQAFQKHCSLRFSTDFFGPFRGEVEDAGYEAGAGFVKIPYTSGFPSELCKHLMEARLKSQL